MRFMQNLSCFIFIGYIQPFMTVELQESCMKINSIGDVACSSIRYIM